MSSFEKKIINQVKNGDVSAYASLINTYQNLAYTLALSITKNKEDAEEVTQDAFVKVYKKIDTFKGNSKFSTWLYQIVYRTALSKIRVKKIELQNIEERYDSEFLLTTAGGNGMDRQDKKHIIKIALSKLNEDDGFILILYYYKEFSIEDIANTTGYTVSNVKVKLFRARKNLLKILEKLMNGQAKSLIQN